MNQALRRYDVVLVDFGDDVIGSEQGGIRPAIIIQNNVGNLHSPTTIVFPFTAKIKNIKQPTHTLIKGGIEKGLKQDSVVIGEAIRQISKKRIKTYLGKITDIFEQNEIQRVKNAI